MIKFGGGGFFVNRFLARYRAWSQYQNLSAPRELCAAEGGIDEPGTIRVYQTHEIEQIVNNPAPVVALDLREGLKEAIWLNSVLPRNKHYIVFSGSKPWPANHFEINHTLICSDCIVADMYDLHFDTTSPYFYTDRTYNFDYPKSHVFVCYNGTVRPHRQQFADWLSQLPYDNYVYRLAAQDLGQSADGLDVLELKTLQGDLGQWFESQARNTPTPHLHMTGNIPTKMLNQAYFNLVLETAYEYGTLYQTEKAFKPLMLGMPFVLASAPGHLAELQRMGFRTYGKLWDESYDREEDHHQRLRLIFELVKKLGSFDWTAHRKELQAIGNHNRANVANLGVHFDNEFKEFERIIKDYERRH